jgi:hypothetical protein
MAFDLFPNFLGDTNKGYSISYRFDVMTVRGLFDGDTLYGVLN